MRIYQIAGAIIFLIVLGLSFFSGTGRIDFNTEIRPILNDKCLKCHGGVKRNGGLSLLSEDDALKGGDSGIASIIPGKPGDSELIRRIIDHDPEVRMPLEMDPLSPEEIKMFKQWIKQGAAWETHWAYVPPVKTILPKANLASWPRNEIDWFILANMENENLIPTPQAESAVIARRLCLDLIGIPLDFEKVSFYIQDPSDVNFEKLVDLLLSSPHFGEKWASMWMDLARYADSKGYEKDPYRSIWKFRDWVIRSFNENKPFDQFTIEQLAGDLLPDATYNQRIATAFHRNTMNNTEGGTEDEEYRIAAVVDRVNTTWTVWQGTTMECAQCHGHPYDPISQTDYYASMAFFNNTQDADLDSEIPFLEEFMPDEDSIIRSNLNWIKTHHPEVKIDNQASLTDQIKQAIFPRLLPVYCDDFNDVEIHTSGKAVNWARLPKNIPNKNFYLKYAQLECSTLEGLTYQYVSSGIKGRIELRRDLPEGPLLHAIDLTKSKNGKPEKIFGEIQPTAGRHDLYVHLINTNAANSDPEGIIDLREIQLNYKNALPEPMALKQKRVELLPLREEAIRTPVMKGRTTATLRKTYLFERGNWLDPSEEVKADVPNMLGALKAENKDRKALADWLTGSENPLTARVIVNRFWEQLFGHGILYTMEDFGTQGMKPSHPELLDWLAVYFRDDLNWDVKAFLKNMVMSSTYRQSSKASTDGIRVDPENIYFSRGPRVRLTAEQVRDQVLAVSGLLSKKMYGPPVMPYQPDGVWQVVYSGASWKTSEGEDKFRRGIYTHWRRTSPYPSMTTFDSPSREFCVPRRIPTNTPLQALVTLNDPVFIEASKALAQRMKKIEAENISAQIATGYKNALMQVPSQNTLDVLTRLYRDTNVDSNNQKNKDIVFQTGTGNEADPEAVDNSLDAMAVVANAILNLDRFIMKE